MTDVSTMATIIAAQHAGDGAAVFYVNGLPGFVAAVVILLVLFVCWLVFGGLSMILSFLTRRKK